MLINAWVEGGTPCKALSSPHGAGQDGAGCAQADRQTGTNRLTDPGAGGAATPRPARHPPPPHWGPMCPVDLHPSSFPCAGSTHQRPQYVPPAHRGVCSHHIHLITTPSQAPKSPPCVGRDAPGVVQLRVRCCWWGTRGVPLLQTGDNHTPLWPTQWGKQRLAGGGGHSQVPAQSVLAQGAPGSCRGTSLGVTQCHLSTHLPSSTTHCAPRCPGAACAPIPGPTWHSHAGDSLGLAQRVHFDVLEALAGGTLQVPAVCYSPESPSCSPKSSHTASSEGKKLDHCSLCLPPRPPSLDHPTPLVRSACRNPADTSLGPPLLPPERGQQTLPTCPRHRLSQALLPPHQASPTPPAGSYPPIPLYLFQSSSVSQNS